MWRFKPSKYKNAAPKIPKKPEGWVTDISIGNLQSSGNHIQASAAFVAFNVEAGGGGSLGILHLDDFGSKRASLTRLNAHADFINDFKFCPYDDGVLATGSQDHHVKLWRIAHNTGELDLLLNPIVDLVLDDALTSLGFNPVIDCILSTAADKQIQLWDVQAQKEIYACSHDDHVQNLSWKLNGELFATCGKDKKLKIWDPRDATASQVTNNHSNNRDARVLWLGNTDNVLTTGFGSGREREMFVRDIKKFNEPIFSYTGDSSLGVWIPLFDADTNMLFLVAKADAAVSFWEMTEQSPFLQEASKYMGTVQAKGAALVPKRGLDVMKGEVNRLLILGSDCIAPIPYIVPRKSYREFHSDLFPDTPRPDPLMTISDWLSGKSAKHETINLNTNCRGNKPYLKFDHELGLGPLTNTTTKVDPLEEEKANKTDPIKEEKINTENKSMLVNPENLEIKYDDSNSENLQKPPLAPKPKSPALVCKNEARKPLGIVNNVCNQSAGKTEDKPAAPERARPTIAFGIRSSKFRHLNGQFLPNETNVTDVGSLTRTLPGESDVFQINPELMALPLGVGGGGFIGLINMGTQGRAQALGDMPGVMCGTKCLDFTWDPFDCHRLVTACDNGEIQIWDIKEEHLSQKVSMPTFTLRPLSDKVSILKFHPCASDILCVAGSDMLVRIWDLSSRQVEMCLEGHTDQILGMAWSHDGQLLATVCKDQKIRVFDPRRSSEPIKEGQGPEGIRGARIVWVLNSTHIVISGFNKVSERQIYMYDLKDVSQPLGNHGLDVSPATLIPHYDEDSSTLFLSGKGDATVHAFEVAEDSPYFHPLSHYKCSGPHQALAFFPKNVCNVRDVEFARSLRLTTTSIETLSFRVPRVRAEYFQDDLFPSTRVTWEPTMTASDWLSGNNKPEVFISLKPSDMISLSQAPPPSKSKTSEKSADATPIVFEGDVFLEGSLAFLSGRKEKEEKIVQAMMSKCHYQQNSLPQDAFEGVDPEEWDKEELEYSQQEL